MRLQPVSRHSLYAVAHLQLVHLVRPPQHLVRAGIHIAKRARRVVTPHVDKRRLPSNAVAANRLRVGQLSRRNCLQPASRWWRSRWVLELAGKASGAPYTTSAAETAASSLGAALRPSRTHGRCSNHALPAALAHKLSFSWRWNRSTSPLLCG